MLYLQHTIVVLPLLILFMFFEDGGRRFVCLALGVHMCHPDIKIRVLSLSPEVSSFNIQAGTLCCVCGAVLERLSLKICQVGYTLVICAQSYIALDKGDSHCKLSSERLRVVNVISLKLKIIIKNVFINNKHNW